MLSILLRLVMQATAMYSSLALAATAAALVSAQTRDVANATNGYTNYSTVTGYFLQDVATTNASTFDYV